MAKSLSPEAAVQVIKSIFDHYGLDRSPDRDHSKDGEAFQAALFFAARDGLLSAPQKVGRTAIWTGALGLELVKKVEAVKAEAIMQGIRRPTNAEAIKIILDIEPKWSEWDDLDKRYYDAKRYWTHARTLMLMAPK